MRMYDIIKQKRDGIKLSKTYTEADIKVNTAKVVPVKPVFEGIFKNKIKSSRVQGETVKIYGSYEKIKDIKEIETEPIIASGKSETEKITAKFILPIKYAAIMVTITVIAIICHLFHE